MYVDTSALVALYIPEKKSEAIQRLVSASETVSISTLCEVEFASAVSRRVRMKELTKIDGRRVLSTFGLHVREQAFAMIPIWQKEYDLAKEWLSHFDSPLRTLDAIHLGIAFSNSLPMVTADRILAKAAGQFGVPTTLV